MRRNNYCQYCHILFKPLQISRSQKFCSRKCKNDSQKHKILTYCGNCGKQFLIFPYLKKEINYCSRECYWEATRKKQEKKCKRCGKKFIVKDYLLKQGFGKFCSRKCQFIAYKKKKIKIVCKNCGKEFWIAPSVAKRKRFCGKKCKDDYERDYVSKICKNCKKKFLLPRWEVKKGKGTFCGRECYFRFNGESSIEALIRKELEKANVNFEQEVQIGKFCVDFLISDKKIVVECDGEYWHNSAQVKKRDDKRNKFLESRGYHVYRFTETQIKTSPKNCVKQILSLKRGEITMVNF